MSQDKFRERTREVVHLADVRRRLEAEREDTVAPIREEFMGELGDLMDDYLDEIRAATGGDPDKLLEELMATCSTVLALAAEEHSDDPEERADFIDTVAEIATELVTEENTTGDLFDDER
ncbi:MAG: hypothetical protein ACOY33_02745 [Pseudomonadota bacterium]